MPPKPLKAANARSSKRAANTRPPLAGSAHRLVKSAQSPAAALSGDQLTELAEMFRLMGDPSRLGIILACLIEPIAVGDIAERLGLSASLVSHHLRLLRAARVLRSERRGKQVFYSAADDHIRCVIRDMADHLLEPHPEGRDS